MLATYICKSDIKDKKNFQPSRCGDMPPDRALARGELSRVPLEVGEAIFTQTLATWLGLRAKPALVMDNFLLINGNRDFAGEEVVHETEFLLL